MSDLLSYLGVPLFISLSLIMNGGQIASFKFPSLKYVKLLQNCFLFMLATHLLFTLFQFGIILGHIFLNTSKNLPLAALPDAFLALLDNLVLISSISLFQLLIPLLMVLIQSVTPSKSWISRVNHKILTVYAITSSLLFNLFYFPTTLYLNQVNDHLTFYAFKMGLSSFQHINASLFSELIKPESLMTFIPFGIGFIISLKFYRYLNRFSESVSPIPPSARWMGFLHLVFAFLILRSWIPIVGNSPSHYILIHSWRLHPVFSLVDEYKDHYSGLDQMKSISNKELNKYIGMIQRELLKRKSIKFFNQDYPLMQKGLPVPNTKVIRPNIVLIFLESFTFKERATAKEKHPTPYFASLVPQGVFFPNHFANGTHSTRAYSSTLCSIFPIYGEGLVMKDFNTSIHCLPDILKKQGYERVALYGGRFTFQNTDRFFLRHNIEKLIGDDNFVEAKKAPGIWGTLDESLFKESLRWIKNHQKDQPFFMTIITLTNHHPYDVPEEKYNRFGKKNQARRYMNTLFYTDQMLKMFMEEFKNNPLMKSQFENTIFVMVGDHGLKLTKDNNLLPVNLTGYIDDKSSNVPLLLYGPKWLSPMKVDHLASQIDITPTLLNILNLAPTNSFLGMDLLKHEKAKHNTVIQYNNRTKVLHLKSMYSSCGYPEKSAPKYSKVRKDSHYHHCLATAEAWFWAVNTLTKQNRIWTYKDSNE